MKEEYHHPLPRDDAKTPDQAIRKIRYADREHLYVFKNGKQIRRFVGERDRVTLPDQYLFELRDAIVVHNHPFGTSFSLEDIEMTIAHNIRKFIVVTEGFTYTVIRPHDGWPDTFDQEYIHNRFEICKSLAQEMSDKLISQNEISLYEKDATIIHYIWVLFFHNTNISYAKKELET